MRTAIAGALLLASIAACGVVENESTETNDLYGLGTAVRGWGDTSGAIVPVCWVDPDSHIDLQIRVREILRESWESYANISFTGTDPSEPFGGAWGPCSEQGVRSVWVDFSETADFPGLTRTSYHGTTVTLMSNDALAANYGHFRYEVLHEFGHALGFMHEQQRPDNWPYGTAMQCLPDGVNPEEQYLPVAGGINLTPTYDVNSVMNYCNPANAGWPQDLSLGDVSGARAAYGRRDVKGDIYRVGADDQLHWYRHDGRTNGAPSWAYGSGNAIDQSWAFKDVFAGGGSSGILYTIDYNNTLRWTRHDGRVDGGDRWAFNSGAEIGWGWDFTKLFGAGDGVIYGITPRVPAHYETVGVGGNGNLVPASGGELKWYRYDGGDTGDFAWAAASGNSIGNRWDSFSQVFYAGNGVIYGITPYVPAHYETVGVGGNGNLVPASGGNLYWYRHLGQANGAKSWTPNSGKILMSGWGSYKKVFSGGDGVIYAIDSTDRLLWFRHDGRDTGGTQWAPGSGTPVGWGWTFKHLVSDD